MKEKMRDLVMMMIVILSWMTLTTLVPATRAQDVVRFDVANGNETDYSQLLTEIRRMLTDPRLNYGGTGLPVMRAPSDPTQYLYVDLVSYGKTITIALNRNDLYVVGYLDSINGRYRAQFFLDAPTNAETDAFPQAQPRHTSRLFYKGSYEGIETKTSVNKRVSLGMQPLNNLINKVYGAAQVKANQKKQARFLLVVIHMVSEAARSKYLENKIIENYYGYYVPDPKALRLELRWSRISKGINNSNNGVINPVLDLIDVDGNEWRVSQVRDIVNEMGLLKNVRERDTRLSQYPKMFMRSVF